MQINNLCLLIRSLEGVVAALKMELQESQRKEKEKPSFAVFIDMQSS